MTLFTIFAAQYLIYIVAVGGALAIGWGVRNGRRELLWILAVALPLGYALARVAGLFYFHYQPFAELGFEPLISHAINNSFPSDHTVVAGVFSAVAFLADRRAGLVLWALTLLVGAARAAAGLHWPVDILASCALALVAALAAHKALSIITNRSRQARAQGQR